MLLGINSKVKFSVQKNFLSIDSEIFLHVPLILKTDKTKKRALKIILRWSWLGLLLLFQHRRVFISLLKMVIA